MASHLKISATILNYFRQMRIQEIHSTSSVDFIRPIGGSLSAIDCKCYNHAKGACKQCLRKLPFFRSQKLCRR